MNRIFRPTASQDPPTATTADPLIVAEIASLDDPSLLPWLALYETAFPPAERILVATLLGLLRRRATGLTEQHRCLAALDGQEVFAGLAWDEMNIEQQVAFLWYLAVAPDRRSQGIGSRFCQAIVAQVRPHYWALFLEVEMPLLAETEGLRRLAWRRIQFYRR